MQRAAETSTAAAAGSPHAETIVEYARPTLPSKSMDLRLNEWVRLASECRDADVAPLALALRRFFGCGHKQWTIDEVLRLLTVLDSSNVFHTVGTGRRVPLDAAHLRLIASFETYSGKQDKLKTTWKNGMRSRVQAAMCYALLSPGLLLGEPPASLAELFPEPARPVLLVLITSLQRAIEQTKPLPLSGTLAFAFKYVQHQSNSGHLAALVKKDYRTKALCEDALDIVGDPKRSAFLTHHPKNAVDQDYWIPLRTQAAAAGKERGSEVVPRERPPGWKRPHRPSWRPEGDNESERATDAVQQTGEQAASATSADDGTSRFMVDKGSDSSGLLKSDLVHIKPYVYNDTILCNTNELFRTHSIAADRHGIERLFDIIFNNVVHANMRQSIPLVSLAKGERVNFPALGSAQVRLREAMLQIGREYRKAVGLGQGQTTTLKDAFPAFCKHGVPVNARLFDAVMNVLAHGLEPYFLGQMDRKDKDKDKDEVKRTGKGKTSSRAPGDPAVASDDPDADDIVLSSDDDSLDETTTASAEATATKADPEQAAPAQTSAEPTTSPPLRTRSKRLRESEAEAVAPKRKRTAFDECMERVEHGSMACKVKRETHLSVLGDLVALGPTMKTVPRAALETARDRLNELAETGNVTVATRTALLMIADSLGE